MRACRSVAQSGSAPRSGRGGRRFESSHSDHFRSDVLAKSQPARPPNGFPGLSKSRCPGSLVSGAAVNWRMSVLVIRFIGRPRPRSAEVPRAQTPGLGRVRVACLAVLCAGPASAQLEADAQNFLTRVNKSVVALAGSTDAQASAACGHIMFEEVNIEAVVRSGAALVWEKMSPNQRPAYRAAVQKRAVHDCVRENRGNSGAPLQAIGVRRGEGGARLLATRSTQEVAARAS